MSRSKRRRSLEEPQPEIDEAYRRLAEESVIAPLELGGTDERAWADCDLASLAENQLGERLDPADLDEARRADWSSRATRERLWPPAAREYERCFWLLAAGERAGTVALGTTTLGGTRARLSSLYVFPRNRRRGTARRALERIRDVLGAHDLATRLETSWTWQPTLRFYLNLGMWVHMWKREVDLWWEAAIPSPIVDVGERVATLSVGVEGERVVLVRAEREGDRLVSFESVWHAAEKARQGPPHPGAERIETVAWDATSTLAVALATHGWPLLEKPDEWKGGWKGDGGSPEGLAWRIVCWEAWSKKHGWRVETPRIPGLRYSTWEELEAE